MKSKKVSAPLSYNPGKGRPKEYLAYLNEREMAYLRSINGNNMERGPRGLPSFPPNDAIGSSSRSPSSGPGGPSGPNSGPSSGGGGSLGGGGQRGPGGPSGPNSGPSGGQAAPGGSPSSPGGLRGAGGNYGPGSGRPGTTSSAGGGYKGPSSPMGGQGPSFSRDTRAQQEAQVRDAISAVKNTPAFRNDAASGGIRTLSVGPLGTPVNVGPSVAPTLYGANKQIYDRVPIGKQFKELGIGYDERIPAAPLGPREYSPYGMSIPDVVKTPTKGISVSGGLGISALPSSGLTLSKTSFDEDSFNDFREGTSGIESLGDLYDASNTSIGVPGPETPKKDYVEGVDEPRNLPVDVKDVFGPFAPERMPTEPRDAEYGGFISPAAAATPDIGEKILEVETVPESAGMSFTPNLPTYNVKDSIPARNREKYINAVTPSGAGDPFQKVSGVGDVYDPNVQFSEQPKIPSNIQGSYPGGVRSIDVDEPTDDRFSRIQSSGEIVRDGEFGYPTNADGSPITAEDLSNMPEAIQKEYLDKVRYSRNYDTPYPLTKAEKEKGFVAGVVTSPIRRGPVGALLKGLSFVPGEFGRAAGNLSSPRKAVNEYDRLDPLKKQQMRERAGKGRGFDGGSTSTTSPGGGKSDIGSGGKNEPIRIKPLGNETSKPPAKPGEDGPRPAIYYKWDLGIDIPSPGDSDYTLYLKYLQEKEAAKAAVS